MNRIISKSATIIKSVRNLGKPPFSHLYIVIDSPKWVLSVEAKYMLNLVWQLGISSEISQLGSTISPYQCFHHTSQFDIMHHFLNNKKDSRRRSYDIFHGRPDQDPVFKDIYDKICHSHERIHRIRVSCTSMQNLMYETGINQEKVHRIPIAVDTDLFRMQTDISKQKIRQKYNIPQSAIVIGSFQKDGNGWGEGYEPKLIKGPDIFLEVLKILKSRVKNLFVLLSGPARGYVKKGLVGLDIPFCHVTFSDYTDVPLLYHALDLYLVTSREEGGPKAVLESMASGIPLVTTRVGQAVDLLRHEENGWMVDVEDVEQLAQMCEYALENAGSQSRIAIEARKTAEANSYSQQSALWKSFFTDYVSFC